MQYNIGFAFKFLIITSIGLSTMSINAETIRLRPANDTSTLLVSDGSGESVNPNSRDVLLVEAQKMRTEGIEDKAKIQELQDKLREAYTALDRESTKAAYRGEGFKGEIALGEWKLNPVKTLRQNMMEWRSQAEQSTSQTINFMWELPGPVELALPATFYGTWKDALWQLSLAFQENNWDIEIEVAKTNNVVIFKPFYN